MQRLLLVGSVTALMLAISAGHRYSTANAETGPATAETVLKSEVIAFGDECADEVYDGCSEGEHKLVVVGSTGDFNAPHTCQEPAIHFGPGCGQGGGSFTLAEVRELTVQELKQRVASITGDANVIIDEVTGVVDVYSCDQSVIVGRVPFEQMAQ